MSDDADEYHIESADAGKFFFLAAKTVLIVEQLDGDPLALRSCRWLVSFYTHADTRRRPMKSRVLAYFLMGPSHQCFPFFYE